MTDYPYETHHLQKNGHVFKRGTGKYAGRIKRIEPRWPRTYLAETAEGNRQELSSQTAALIWLAEQQKY